MTLAMIIILCASAALLKADLSGSSRNTSRKQPKKAHQGAS